MSVNSKKPLRIALVTETYPPEINGVAHTCRQFVQGIRNQGHQVQLVRPHQASVDARQMYSDPQPVVVSSLPLPGYRGLQFGLPAARRLSKIWCQERPDVVHIVTEGPLGSSALRAARNLSVPVVSGFHTNFHQYTQHYRLGWLRPIVERYLRRFHNRCDLTLTPTKELAARLNQLGIRRARVLARGVDTCLFNPRRRSKALRRQWGVNDDRHIVVLHVGRLAPEKNLALAIKAFFALRQDIPNARFVLVGDGPTAESLKARHPDFVFAGTRRGIDLATYYASADVFLFPSQTETFGNVILEAMASGLAVVAFDYAAAGSYIQHGHNGLLAPVADEAAFIGATRRLVREPGWHRQLGVQARSSIRHLSWDHICNELLEHYMYLLQSEGRGKRDIAESLMNVAMTSW